MTLSNAWRTHAGPRRIKALQESGGLGRLTGFQVTASAIPGAEAEPAAYWSDPRNGAIPAMAWPILRLLTWWLGPLTVTACADDAHGGLEAEAVIDLATRDGIAGRLVVSRLRPLPSRACLEGAAGRVEIDLDAFAVTASVPLPSAAPAASEGPDASEAFVEDCRRLRVALAHPWEAPPSPVRDARLSGKAVLVTGATGFIGARLVEKLASEHGARVTALVRSPRRAARIARFDIDLQVADLSQDLSAVVAGKDLVFNLAHDFKRSGATNLAGFRNLAAAAAKAGVGRFVQVSSIAVYDDWPGPDLTEQSPSAAEGGPYKAAKMAMEAELVRRRADGLPYAIVQPTIVYGPFSTLWTDLPMERLEDGAVALPKPAGACNAVYLDDVVDGMILAAVRDEAVGERFILSGSEAPAWPALFKGYAAALGRPEAVRTFTPEPKAPGSSSGLAALIADPLRLAEWGPVRAILNGVQRTLGDAAIERLRAVVVGLKRRRGPTVHYPTADEARLYLSTGVCRIDKARTRIGYAPAFDLQRGLAICGAYLRWRRGETPS